MGEYLAMIGGLFVVASLAMCVIDNGASLLKRNKLLSTDDTIRLLGMAGIVVWVCIAFGISSWLVSIVYWFVIKSVGG